MFISFAQAKEDVLLFRALKNVPPDEGFYIDVGANDPEWDSVTKLFYDRGWCGINVEPSPEWFAMLTEQRPRDISIHAAVTDTPGEVTFHDIVGEQLGTLSEEIADRHVAEGTVTKRSFTVRALTLTQICEQHAQTSIQFLKIDVEGFEGQVLEGMDFTRFRPWVLVIEATEPMRLDVPTYAGWDQRVQAAGYTFVFTDVLNRYYVANEHPELFIHFTVPPDEYVLNRDVRHRIHLEKETLRLGDEVSAAAARAERDGRTIERLDSERQRARREIDVLTAAGERDRVAIAALTEAARRDKAIADALRLEGERNRLAIEELKQAAERDRAEAARLQAEKDELETELQVARRTWPWRLARALGLLKDRRAV